MTIEQAKAKARRLASKNQKAYFVVIEAGEIDVCNEYDLETFYDGISQEHILACVEP